MRVISGRNVNEVYTLACQALAIEGKEANSRNGPVLEFPIPATLVYQYPQERVLFYERRDCNPFFHLMESLWMLAGRRDVEWLAQFNKGMRQYSDDGVTFHGAYGYRWRNHFRTFGVITADGASEIGAIDQLDRLVTLLKDDPETRRAVLQMWDPRVDLVNQGSARDIPCNTAIFFKIRKGCLTMTVTNRSNDLIWGSCGANVVHMSILQEYLAARIGVPCGPYYQVSDNLHAYLSLWDEKRVKEPGYSPCYYEVGAVEPYPLVKEPDAWDEDLYRFFEGRQVVPGNYVNPFFPEVAIPVFNAWTLYKAKHIEEAKATLAQQCEASDWRAACLQWIERHPGKRQ